MDSSTSTQQPESESLKTTLITTMKQLTDKHVAKRMLLHSLISAQGQVERMQAFTESERFHAWNEQHTTTTTTTCSNKSDTFVLSSGRVLTTVSKQLPH